MKTDKASIAHKHILSGLGLGLGLALAGLCLASPSQATTLTVQAESFGIVLNTHDFIVDSDGDGLPDLWKQKIIDFDPNDDLQHFSDVHPQDDFDGDGRSNLVKYAFGLDPTSGDQHESGQSMRAVPSGATQVLELTFQARSYNASLWYAVQTSSDLWEGWTTDRLVYQATGWMAENNTFTVVRQNQISPGVWEISIRLPQNSELGFLRVGLKTDASEE